MRLCLLTLLGLAACMSPDSAAVELHFELEASEGQVVVSTGTPPEQRLHFDDHHLSVHMRYAEVFLKGLRNFPPKKAEALRAGTDTVVVPGLLRFSALEDAVTGVEVLEATLTQGDRSAPCEIVARSLTSRPGMSLMQPPEEGADDSPSTDGPRLRCPMHHAAAQLTLQYRLLQGENGENSESAPLTHILQLTPKRFDYETYNLMLRTLRSGA